MQIWLDWSTQKTLSVSFRGLLEVLSRTCHHLLEVRAQVPFPLDQVEQNLRYQAALWSSMLEPSSRSFVAYRSVGVALNIQFPAPLERSWDCAWKRFYESISKMPWVRRISEIVLWLTAPQSCQFALSDGNDKIVRWACMDNTLTFHRNDQADVIHVLHLINIHCDSIPFTIVCSNKRIESNFQLLKRLQRSINHHLVIQSSYL